MHEAFSFKISCATFFAVVTADEPLSCEYGLQQPGGADGARKRDKAGRSRNGG